MEKDLVKSVKKKVRLEKLAAKKKEEAEKIEAEKPEVKPHILTKHEKLIAKVIDTLGYDVIAESVREKGYEATSLAKMSLDSRYFVTELLSDSKELLRASELSKSQLEEIIGVDIDQFKEPFNYFFGKVLETLYYFEISRSVWAKEESIFHESRKYDSVEKYLNEHYLKVIPRHRKMLAAFMDSGKNPSVDGDEPAGGVFPIIELSRLTRLQLEDIAKQYRSTRGRDDNREVQKHRIRGLGFLN